MIELRNFTIGYETRDLLKNVSTKFPPGTLTSLLGRNGTGKSTLMRAMCGINDEYSGEIFIDKFNLKKLNRSQIARKISYVNTMRPRNANLSCENIVALGRSPYTDWVGRLTDADRKIVADALKSVGMEKYSARKIDTLSDGESQRIMIARAIAQDTEIIILDEPTSFLDLPTRFEIAGLLKKLAHSGHKTIIFSTHELDIAIEMSDNIALIGEGCFYNLPVNEMIAKGYLRQTFHLPTRYMERLSI